MTMSAQSFGLFDPAQERASCGVGFIADIKGRKSHKIVEDALTILVNLEHRGAVGADPRAGDGAGILVQTPHKFLAKKAAELGFTLPAPGHYAVGALFLPHDEEWRREIMDTYAAVVAQEGMTILGWRDVPTDNSTLGETVKPTEPVNKQVFLGRGSEDRSRRTSSSAGSTSCARPSPRRSTASATGATSHYYPVSISCRTLIYKGMFLADQLGAYYPDLHDPDFESALALVHQRFSTNTFPTWSLAHPYRMIAHNGEINTLRGNNNWMAARQASVSSPRFGADITKLWPISYEGQSDTACFDNALEFLVMGGYPLAHAVMMMIPEAWAGNPLMNAERRAFYEYNAALMEPWDGPAAIAFTDGRQIGATLDRNGLRPARYLVTRDGRIVMASEMGVLPIPEEEIVTKWRLQPGKMLLVDLEEGRLIPDDEIKAKLARSHPYQAWLDRTQIVLEDLQESSEAAPISNLSLIDRQQAFGYTQEDLKILMTPMATTGEEAVGSMGNDAPISALSDKPKLLFTYFKQNFAQVTNPPIDPIREELVMSLVSIIGPRPNLFDLEGMSNTKRLEVHQPILTNANLEKIRSISEVGHDHFKSLHARHHLARGDRRRRHGRGDRGAVRRGRRRRARRHQHHHPVRPPRRRRPHSDPVAARVRGGASSSDPRGLAHLGRAGRRIRRAARGAPFRLPRRLRRRGDQSLSRLRDADRHEGRAAAEARRQGNHQALHQVDRQGTAQGDVEDGHLHLSVLLRRADLRRRRPAVRFRRQIFHRHRDPHRGRRPRRHRARKRCAAIATRSRDAPIYRTMLDVGGDYAFRVRGEEHVWNAATVATLQHAVRGNSQDKYRHYAALINEQAHRLTTIRGLFDIKSAADDGREPVPLDEVEPAKDIVKRFATGAMSYGSISREAHTTLAIAMNRIGGKSNTGEGGEESDRYKPLPNGDSMRSAIKQVASGRFGVTAEYLVNSDMMQIKIAQGAKPGEGGQLPGHKVDATIAKVRHSTPGVGLISPPPHHDIYSIEDLAQLIFDLKNVNPDAAVSVKLVSEVGVGTVAAGVSKARSDHVTIAGYEGGTGASPLTSIKHAGSPWEIGLAETHQTLVANRLRGRITVQVDGGFRTGRDVVIGALLGADEFGFATAPLIAAGCIMMRKCHLNTCPVGVATQDPVLRRRFTGQPEHVINFFFFVAEEVRELMAALGYRKFSDMIGQMQMLDARTLVDHWKARGLDFSKLFTKPDVPASVAIFNSEKQDHKIHDILDRKLIAQAQSALEHAHPGRDRIADQEHRPHRRRDALGRDRQALRPCRPAARHHRRALQRHRRAELRRLPRPRRHASSLRAKPTTMSARASPAAASSCARRRNPAIVPENSIIVGNTVLYGAIEGECYFRGVAGERFAVRNSGAIAVVEGAGDHCCEYMTGGVVVVLGKTGRNFAAGMSGGIAYVLDERRQLRNAAATSPWCRSSRCRTRKI